MPRAADAGAIAEIADRESTPPSAVVVQLPGIATERAPSPAPPVAHVPWRSYRERLAGLAQQAVDLQRPIRMLNALRWEPGVWDAFRRGGFRELPRVDADAYARMDLGFRPDVLSAAFQELARSVRAEFGERDALAEILRETCVDLGHACQMLAVRGSPEFHRWSRRLFGSPKELIDGRVRVRDLAHSLYEQFSRLDPRPPGGVHARVIDGPGAARILGDRFATYFGDGAVQVFVDAGMLADAAAGTDYVKIREGAMFAARDVDLLEVHEGWVHVATSLNGADQHVARWLAKGSPRTTGAQEGLAALMEMATGRSSARRARRLNERVIAVDKAEDGASFLDVFEWYRTEGYTEEECYAATRRVFRGGTLTGGAPFTKDIAYLSGLAAALRFLRDALSGGRLGELNTLFVGKVTFADVPVLHEHVAGGLIRAPRFLPPPFQDPSGLAVWVLQTASVFGA